MKKLGPAFVCFGIFLAGCGNHAENPSAGSNPTSHHLSKKYESTKQLQPSQSPTPIVDRSDLRQFALTLAAQPMDNENA
jgi:hypothetical protein